MNPTTSGEASIISRAYAIQRETNEAHHAAIDANARRTKGAPEMPVPPHLSWPECLEKAQAEATKPKAEKPAAAPAAK